MSTHTLRTIVGRVTARGDTDRFGPAGTPTVVVVGGGFGGIAAGVKLRQAGIRTFTIYEKSLGIGGTWWDNTYPGAEVDVGSHLYSYSFAPNDWTRTHAKQAELQKYLEGVVDEFELRSHFRFGVGVDRVVWDEASGTYTVHLDDDTTTTAHIVISAVGFLNVPKYPSWPGLETFRGPKFHTSRWEHQHDLTGKTVAVVGTGSTATQIVPEIANYVGHVYLFQREPGWIMPKGDRDFTPEERDTLRNPWRRRKERLRLRYLLEKNTWAGSIFRPGTKVNQAREQFCRDYIAREFADRPDLAEAVTPNYPYPGKRPIFATPFYPSLKRPNVELVPRAVASVTEDGIVDVDGVERKIDVLVMATGFQPANYLARLEVVGRGGRTIREHWAGEPRAFLGITVPGFPNFFILYGPGTNGGEIVTMLESQSEYAVRVAKRLMHGAVAVDVKPRWADRWHRWLQSKMEGTSWTMSNNYFKSETGKIVTQWPYGALYYRLLTKVLGRASETTTRAR
jgi:cation diffusion facilitator CzcD-associated flavoprotein CzcO